MTNGFKLRDPISQIENLICMTARCPAGVFLLAMFRIANKHFLHSIVNSFVIWFSSASCGCSSEATERTQQWQTSCFNVSTVRIYHTLAVTCTSVARHGYDQLIVVICLTNCHVCAEYYWTHVHRNDANDAFDVLVTDDDLLTKLLCCLPLVRLCMFMINDMMPNWHSLSLAKWWMAAAISCPMCLIICWIDSLTPSGGSGTLWAHNLKTAPNTTVTYTLKQRFIFKSSFQESSASTSENIYF